MRRCLCRAAHSSAGVYGAALKQLAAEERCTYLNTGTPWVEYPCAGGVHPHRFHRDPVHANKYGKQTPSKILMAFFHPESHHGQTARVGTDGMTTGNVNPIAPSESVPSRATNHVSVRLYSFMANVPGSIGKDSENRVRVTLL